MRYLVTILTITIATGAFAAPKGEPIDGSASNTNEDAPAPSVEDVFTTPSPGTADRDVFGVPKVREKKPEPEVAPNEETPHERTKDGRYLKVGFSHISGFDYILPDPFAPNPPKVPEDQVPQKVLDLNEKEILIVGYMMPVEVDKDGKVLSFVLVQDQSLCCFGVPPAINQWIGVEAGESGPVEFYSDIPIAVFGTFEVGEDMEDGYVISLYRMKADRVLDIRELMREERK